MSKHRTSIEFPIDLWEALKKYIPARKRSSFIIEAVRERLMRESLKCLILCGGRGTGLTPLTLSIPKSMMPVGYKPIIEHIITYMKTQGIYNFILAIGYLGEHLIKYFGDGRSLNITIDYSVEKIPLGTAGAVKNAEKKLNNTFLTVNGDIIFKELDVSHLIRYHREKNGIATIVLTRVEDARRFGLVSVDDEGRVLAFREKPRQQVPGLVNAGIYVFEPSIFDYIPSDRPSSLEEDVFPELADQNKLYAYLHNGYWIDVGDKLDYEKVCRDFFNGVLS
ncbi:MAG: nucleotidyltransferase family protein [Aigarchaeota archaeon]|nr:nucleotidyltransferase family protein [Aigarchaeota archaeon]MCX8192379.1 nucleotidyltransferase family protein [Nitrososphaeria archaeon]MDW7986952.1 nucleotidyltransferase family protein [Nitrososphaerota archaeon]